MSTENKQNTRQQFEPQAVLPTLAHLQQRLLDAGFTYVGNTDLAQMQRNLAGGGLMVIHFKLSGIYIEATRAMAVEKKAQIQYVGDWVSIVLTKVANIADLYVQTEKTSPSVERLLRKGF